MQSASTNERIQNHHKAYNEIPSPYDQDVSMVDTPSNNLVLSPEAAPRRQRRAAAEKASAARAGLGPKKRWRRQ
jgi:hypothetical protein